jgi:hypothetical protein
VQNYLRAIAAGYDLRKAVYEKRKDNVNQPFIAASSTKKWSSPFAGFIIWEGYCSGLYD